MSLLLKTASIASSGTIKAVQEWEFSLNSWRLAFFCPIAKVGGVIINSILLFYVAMVCKQRIKVARLFQRTFRLPWQINSREISCEWPCGFSTNNPSLLEVASSSYDGKFCFNSLVCLFCKLVLKPFKNVSNILCHWVYVQAIKIIFSLKQGLTNCLCWP